MDTVNEPVPIEPDGEATHSPTEQGANGRPGKKARTVTQDILELGEMAREMAAEKVEQFRASATEYCEQGRGEAKKAERRIEEYIRQRPLKCLLLAAGAGLLLGCLWKRR